MNFYVGQKVVCVKGHEDPMGVVYGHTYHVLGVRKPCGCVDVHVGILDPLKITSKSLLVRCTTCGKVYINDNVWWFCTKRFRPLLGDEQEQLTAIEEEVKEEELIPV